MNISIDEMAVRAKDAAKQLLTLDAKAKNRALIAMADEIARQAPEIVVANDEDVAEAASLGLSGSLLKRLRISGSKLDSMVNGVKKVSVLPDPVGRIVEHWQRPNGLAIRKTSVPFGVVGIIYESRPDVTSDAAALCFKSGNAALLRGGSESRRTNLAVAKALRCGLTQAGVTSDCVQYVADPDRSVVTRMLRMRGAIDLLIPRGGAGLIKTVVENALVPVIETGTGNCHIYVHEKADLSMAEAIIVNAKCSNPAVCNAVETVLVDHSVAERLLPPLVNALAEKGVEIRGCDIAKQIAPSLDLAVESDWETEYLDLVLAVKVVDGFDEAVRHIAAYGTKHSDAIITSDKDAAAVFRQVVDASCVYVNASTRFTDGYEFGFGAEIGISTQKLHARGPMALAELTTYKYIVDGSGQIR